MKEILIKTISMIIISSQIFHENVILLEKQKPDAYLLSYKYDIDATQIYESYDDMTNSLSYVDDNVFEDIEIIFEEVEWYTDFDKGDLEKYDFYLSKYAELLLLKQPYKDGVNETIQMVDELLKTPDAGDVFSVHMDNYVYYVYDYDGDGKAELCIKDLGRIFVFRYDESEDCIYLIDSVDGNASLGGTGTQYAYGGNTCRLLKVESYEEAVKWREVFTFYPCEGNEYFLMFPLYADRENTFFITDSMKDQSGLLINEAGANYYFKITNEQYDRLISYFLDARNLTNQEIETVRYQYDEIIKHGF